MDDVWCKILRHLPLTRSKAALSLVCVQWARCLAITDSYREAIGYVNGNIALRQTLSQACVTLDDLHRNTVDAQVHCARMIYSLPLPKLVKLTLNLKSHDQCIKFPPATADMLPHLEELHINNKGDMNSTDHALEWDLRSMPVLKQVPCDSLNEAFEWDLRQLPKLQRVCCGSTRMPQLQLPSSCRADVELQLFMQQSTFEPDCSGGLQPRGCVGSLHLDRLWVGASVIGEHPGRDQRLSLLGSILDVKHLSLAVHFGDVLAQSGGKLIFPELVVFESCDVYAMIHGKHSAGNCIGLCERSLELPVGWEVRIIACGTPDAPSSAVRGQWKGLDFRYYDPSEQTHAHMQLKRVVEQMSKTS